MTRTFFQPWRISKGLIRQGATWAMTVSLAALTAALIAACGGEPEPEQPPEIYRVRGIVRHIPEATQGSREISVRHEAIPGFKSSQGEIVGMESMTMPFPLATPEMADDLTAGDKIEIEFEVRWHGGNPLAITAIEKLPAETPLAFEAGPPSP